MADAVATRVAEQLAAPALSAEEREEILTARNFVERHGGFAETVTTLDRLLEGQAAVASRPQRSQAVSVERCVAEQLAARATERISAAVRSALKAVNFGAYSYHELMMGSDRLYASVERCVAEQLADYAAPVLSAAALHMAVEDAARRYAPEYAELIARDATADLRDVQLATSCAHQRKGIKT